MIRKKPPVSIFTQKKKPARKPAAVTKTSAPGSAPNSNPAQQSRPTANGTTPGAQPVPERKNYTEFPILASKETLMQGLKYHAMRLQNRQDNAGNTILVNPYDERQFTRPVHLHRRNARDKLEPTEQSDAASGVDDKEKELMSIRRAERQAEREANQALIAPTGGDPKKTIRRKQQKKVEDVYYDENNPKQSARAQLRYEEARPWHLEDFESKNVWVGSYEEPLSKSSVMFEIGQAGFKMIPVEKWYRFTQTNKVAAMDSDAVEKHMSRKFKAPRWFLGTQEANDEERRRTARAQRERTLAQMRGVDDEDRSSAMKREEYQADVDEIDFEFNDEFQDDDEGLIFGDADNDDTKEIEKRIREEMREANLGGTGVKDEDRDWDEEENKEKAKEHDERKRAKRIKKQLIKKERKNEYDSESDRGEFSESSESEDSEEERERLLEEEKKKQEEAAKAANGDKSGASTRGTNTPSGRLEKRDLSKSLGASLKRPGSPDLSEMSGNESSRKKAKGVNGRALSPSTVLNGARSLSRESIAVPYRTTCFHHADHHLADTAKVKRSLTGGSGSGSDTDTSRTGRPKLRLKASPPASPHEGRSRAASPSGSNSRAQSPQRKAFPTLEELRAAIPPDGIGISDLVKIFKARITSQRQAEFIALVKQAGKQDAASKKILPKPLEGPA